MATGEEESLLKAARKEDGFVVSVYRMLHQIPELLYDLNKTSAVVRRVLDDIDVEYRCVLQCSVYFLLFPCSISFAAGPLARFADLGWAGQKRGASAIVQHPMVAVWKEVS